MQHLQLMLTISFKFLLEPTHYLLTASLVVVVVVLLLLFLYYSEHTHKYTIINAWGELRWHAAN